MSRFDDNASLIQTFCRAHAASTGTHGNLRYAYHVLYSYALPIASRQHPDITFILSSAYAPSPTTQRHISLVTSACNQLPYIHRAVLHVAIVPTHPNNASEAHQLELHTANLLRYHTISQNALDQLKSRRTAPHTKSCSVITYNRAVHDHQRYCHHFALPSTPTSLHPFAPPLPLTQALPPDALALLALNNIDPTATD